MRRYILASDANAILHLATLPTGGLLRIRLLHAEDEDYRQPQPLSANAVQRGHAHDVYHICLYTGGESRFLLGDRLYACRAGTLAVTSPGEFHDFRAHGGGWANTLEFTLTVGVEGAPDVNPLPFLTLLSCCVGMPLPPVAWPVQLSGRQTHQAEALLDALLLRLTSRDALLYLDAERMTLDFFRFLAHEVHGVGDALSDARDPLVRARAEIESRFHERLRLPELARAAGLSTGHFSRAFKARHGVAPMAYQLELRVRSAKTLLCFGAMSVGEIARRVGFPDIYTFSRMFRRSQGVSPRAYRNGQARPERGATRPADPPDRTRTRRHGAAPP